MHYLIKELAPPIVNTLRFFSFKYGWKGNYKTFDEAAAKCGGYNEGKILERIIKTTKMVKTGEAVYERDGIIYDEIHLNANLLNALLLVAYRNNNNLNVVDFGGLLGTTYYQNIKYLSHLNLTWNIVEQAHFVEIGKKSFENNHIKFHYTIDECLAKIGNADIMIINGVIQYIKNPYDMLAQFQSYSIPYLIFDTMGYNDNDSDRITIQNVPPIFYGIAASYPCTFFNKTKFENQLLSNYNKEFEFLTEQSKYYINFKPFRYEGSFWRFK